MSKTGNERVVFQKSDYQLSHETSYHCNKGSMAIQRRLPLRAKGFMQSNESVCFLQRKRVGKKEKSTLKTHPQTHKTHLQILAEKGEVFLNDILTRRSLNSCFTCTRSRKTFVFRLDYRLAPTGSHHITESLWLKAHYIFVSLPMRSCQHILSFMALDEVVLGHLPAAGFLRKRANLDKDLGRMITAPEVLMPDSLPEWWLLMFQSTSCLIQLFNTIFEESRGESNAVNFRVYSWQCLHS